MSRNVDEVIEMLEDIIKTMEQEEKESKEKDTSTLTINVDENQNVEIKGHGNFSSVMFGLTITIANLIRDEFLTSELKKECADVVLDQIRKMIEEK